jgi:DNA-binding ferritin-like protein
MTTETSFTQQLDDLLESYQSLLKTCYDALDESVDQATRDSLRKQIEGFVAASTD